MQTMRAVLIDRITEAKDIRLSSIPVPQVKPGWVLVKVRAFGLNHSEKILRQSEIEADYIQKPVVPGIECAGEIEDPSDSSLEKGQKVVALMGGMGRSFNGSYAEYALLPAHHVFPVRTSLAWEDLASVPETYFTAWGSLFESLKLESSDTLIIRGASCALGYAAIKIAKGLGCKVIATTHRESKLPLISEADLQILDDGMLRTKKPGANKALDLIGPRFLKDTLASVPKGGIVCQTGLLGGIYYLNGFDPIKDIPNGVYLTGYVSNFPTQRDMDDIFGFIKDHNIKPEPGAVFSFDDIQSAVAAQDAGSVNGKIVVAV